MSDQPTPFTIVRNPGEPEVASNGVLGITCPDAGGRVFLRRGIRTSGDVPLGERLIPSLNQLAGELLATPGMPAHEIRARLHILAVQCLPPVVENIEWACAELDGVRAYTDGSIVILTKHDMQV